MKALDQITKGTDGTWQDVLGNGDIKRKILSSSPLEATDVKPISGDQIVIKYTERIFSNQKITEFQNNFEFILGDGDVLPVIDLGVKLMYPGETSLFVVEPRFAYGKIGREPEITGTSKMSYEITLLDVKEGPNYQTLSPGTLLNLGTDKKNRGNWWYGRDEYGYAIDSYSRGVRILENFDNAIPKSGGDYDKIGQEMPPKSETKENLSGSEESDESLSKATLRCAYEDLDIALHNNLAAAQLKVEAFEAALRSLNHVLVLRPMDVKALYRKSKVLTALGDVEGALETLGILKDLEPTNKAFVADASALLKVKRKADVEERLVYQRMFGAPKYYEGERPSGRHDTLYVRMKGIVTGIPCRLKSGNFTFLACVALTSLLFLLIGIKYMDWTLPQSTFEDGLKAM